MFGIKFIACEYDLRGRKTYEGGATYPVRYEYDILGNKISMTTYRAEPVGRPAPWPPQGDVTRWLYDEPSGLVTNKIYVDGMGPSYDYSADGRLVSRRWARGIVTTYAYDGWGNLTITVYSDSTPAISVRYDAMDRQVEVHDAAGTTTFLYDDFGSCTNETVVGVAGTNTIVRCWDSFGRSLGYALVGRGPDSIDESEYHMFGPKYDDKIMRKAIKNLVESGEWKAQGQENGYNVIRHNCQDFAEAARQEYERLGGRTRK